jgi:hypothetical protein
VLAKIGSHALSNVFLMRLAGLAVGVRVRPHKEPHSPSGNLVTFSNQGVIDGLSFYWPLLLHGNHRFEFRRHPAMSGRRVDRIGSFRSGRP